MTTKHPSGWAQLAAALRLSRAHIWALRKLPGAPTSRSLPEWRRFIGKRRKVRDVDAATRLSLAEADAALWTVRARRAERQVARESAHLLATAKVAAWQRRVLAALRSALDQLPAPAPTLPPDAQVHYERIQAAAITNCRRALDAAPMADGRPQ